MSMKKTRIISCVLGLVLIASSTSVIGQGSNQYWMSYAEKLPIGSTVRVRTTDGKRLTAILAIVDKSGVTLAPKTRIPEPPRHIPYERLDQLELKENGSSVGKAVAIGAAIGVGAFFGVLAILAASFD